MWGYAGRLCVTVIAWLSAIAMSSTTPKELIPTKSAVVDGYTTQDSIEARLKESALHPIEGIWQMADNGAIITIEQAEPTSVGKTLNSGYRIVIVQSPNRRIRPGTVMGYAMQSAKAGKYDAAIYTAIDDDGTLRRTKRFTLELHDSESRLAFIRHKSDLRVDLWRLIPYLFRVSISTGSDRPHDMDGAIRIFPATDATPINPRYL